jgi:hypothetical protein
MILLQQLRGQSCRLLVLGLEFMDSSICRRQVDLCRGGHFLLLSGPHSWKVLEVVE